MKIRKEDS